MGVTGFQDFWIAGSRMYFKRDPVLTVDQPLFDLGVLQQATPALEVTEVELKDADCGLRRTVAKQVTDMTETFSVECSNFNPENLSLLLMATPAEAFTQSATPQTDVTQDPAHLGYLLKIKDAAGDPVYNLTSFDALKDPTAVTTYVLDTDYEIVSLERGLIRIIGVTIPEGELVKASFTPVALTGKRMVKPQTTNNIEGELFLFYSREGCAEQSVRHARCSITPSAAGISSEDFSSMTFNVTILADATADVPAGEMLYFEGTVPDAS